jgi:hypothetical protein
MAYTLPAAPEQGYAPEFFGPTEGGGQMSAMSPGEGFPEWQGYDNEREGGSYGRGGYGGERYGYNYSPGYEAPKPQAPRRYDYGLTTWRF